MRRNDDYVIVNEGEIWRCTGTNESYDYFVLYVGGGFITGYTLSTYGPRSRDERGITVDDTTYWYHPAKINYIRKNRLDYRVSKAVEDRVLHAARWDLTRTLGCGEYVDGLRSENKNLKASLDTYKDVIANMTSSDQRGAQVATAKSIREDEHTLTEIAERMGFDSSPTRPIMSGDSYDDLIFHNHYEFNDYLAFVWSNNVELTPSIRTRATNTLHRYLNKKFGNNKCFPISKSSLALIVRDSDLTGVGKKSRDFLYEAFPLNIDTYAISEEDSNEE
jgi:hypothetical protein